MSSGTITGAQMNRIRGRIDLLTNQSRIFNEVKGILEDADECGIMIEESEDDQESIKLIKEEIAELKIQMEEIQPSLLDNILEPEEFDDCEAAVLEFRAGVGGTES